jgi:hypothetical protein
VTTVNKSANNQIEVLNTLVSESSELIDKLIGTKQITKTKQKEIDNMMVTLQKRIHGALLIVSNLKQSLKGIVHYNNKHNNSANPDDLYCHEGRPRVMIDEKSVRQSRFAVLSSKEKNKLPPKSNLSHQPSKGIFKIV